mgnify:CR=1 FL=1
MKKKILCLMLFVLSLPWFYKQNNVLEVNEIKIHDKRIPINFDGFRIVQLSDFHNTTLGKENNQLIEQLKEAKPNIIVITGDFIDSRMTDVDKALSLIVKIKEIAPIYYVTGNHESRIKVEYDLLEKFLEQFEGLIKQARNDLDINIAICNRINLFILSCLSLWNYHIGLLTLIDGLFITSEFGKG